MSEQPDKVTVENPVKLADETISKLIDQPRTGGRAGDAAAAKAVDELITVSTIEHVSSPHAQEEEKRTSESQRHVNLIWENTQRIVALSVIEVSLFVGAWLAIVASNENIQMAAVVFLFGAANLVTGFYFGRTNHQKIGGIQQGR